MSKKKISDYLTTPEILAQLGEEAAELVQAALKLRRALDGTNPTPKSVNECMEALEEEYADVIVCVSAIDEIDPDKFKHIVHIVEIKHDRWLKRLKEAEP